MINEKFYVNVAGVMAEKKLTAPRCRLPRPKLKPIVFVTGWGEWLPCIVV